ncbi:MAG: enoyl-CoA hydratase/isomerase family protein, partial [bacterium]
MRSRRPWCFSHPTTAATSRERNCLWMAAWHKCRRANMAYENLLYEVREGIATVTVNRPKVLNALNRATITELHAAFTAARDDEAVRVIVLT